jgi:hypothetical protein
MPRGLATPIAQVPAWTLAVIAIWSCATAERKDPGDATLVQSVSLSAAGIQHVGVLTEDKGSLVLEGGDKDSLIVSYVLNARNPRGIFPNQVETIDKGDTMVVGIHPTPGTSIDLRVTMPERVTLLIQDQARDVIVNNIENRVDVLMHAGGSLEFDDVEGPLSIADGGGPIRLHHVRGPIEIRDESGRIDIREVSNNVTIDSRVGDVALEKVGGDVTLSVGAGDLTVRDVTGKLIYRKVGPGKVTIENVAGGVEKL